ncbi:cyclin-D4-1-like [Gastrolobium bilobum]|uniref:cyclin-D4-1-like n=1 Tax=Gastrolobium bilobum TaxID=150636 RepID=UPI002AAF923B|nr:cyclin-D4-1-like [Gastrolobium bilobum]
MSLSPDHSAASSLLCGEDVGDVITDNLSPPLPASLPPAFDEAEIAGLMHAETHHIPEKDYLRRCRDRFIDITARLDAINWILKVHAFYQFRPVTAFLSVNYLDRFLSCSSLPRPSGWAFQLLSVACLSLAAKMEEPQVPLLLDLQLFQPRFVFEPKTVQRMELRVMANLKWRLRSVTPFDYLDYFISKLPSSSSSSSDSESMNWFISTASDLILSTTRVIDFLGFAPSTVAAAAVLCSAGHTHEANGQLPLSFHDRVNKEMVRCCHQLMEEYVVDTCPASRPKGRRAEPAPPSSPVGVLDAATCGSCDTRSERNENGSRVGQAEPPNSKRLRSSAPDVQQR